MNFLLGPFLMLGFAATVLATDARANLIANGSFESRTPGFVGPYLPLYTGDTSIDGWTVISEGVDYYNTFWPAQDGVYSIDLNGSSSDDNTPGGLTQSFPTQVGQPYRVSFWLGANGGPSNPQRAKIGVQTGASFFGDIYSVVWAFPLPGTWTEHGFSFVAESTTSTLVFESLQLLGDGGVTVDNVSVAEVPTPSALGLVVAALLVLFGTGGLMRVLGAGNRGRAATTESGSPNGDRWE